MYTTVTSFTPLTLGSLCLLSDGYPLRLHTMESLAPPRLNCSSVSPLQSSERA